MKCVTLQDSEVIYWWFCENGQLAEMVHGWADKVQ